ncbi:MAG: UDP-N-acetylmuramoyl-tripeptide--D-alanyl-D-alanine ligase, partial [Candidatus Eremiobacteraeota bacterium]|nr:UDP-N-acetylmuramoyl-tripeptide--D-alanyl-D-alanine ligase [Candidatus Eremiobacteraeota bacterium]
MNLPLEAALEATGGTLLDGDSAPVHICVSTDTRTLEPGETFLALHGQNFDGHAFAADALRNGAALLVVDRPDARIEGVPALLVSDTLRAYMALARLARRRFRGRVLAITGSTGKTTCKAFVTQLLQARYGDRVLAAPANENNEIAVSKLLLQASNDAHDIIVIEMGARHFGDIATL